jgi:hypothetical protein
MARIWKEREKQIDRVLANTAGIYGEVRGILGQSEPRCLRSNSTRSADGWKTRRRIWSTVERRYSREGLGLRMGPI